MKYVIGVDVGTASVRAALVQSDGRICATETKSIRIWNPQPDFYQQSSDDIWEAVTFTVKVLLQVPNKSVTDLFVRFDSLRPINNISVKQGWVFLG